MVNVFNNKKNIGYTNYLNDLKNIYNFLRFFLVSSFMTFKLLFNDGLILNSSIGGSDFSGDGYMNFTSESYF